MPAETLHIEPIPAFEDNYIWLLHNKRDAVVIDPGDATPVINILEKYALKLRAILITHHHSDHIDGVEQLLGQYPAQVYAPKYEQYNFEHTAVSASDQIDLDYLNLKLKVLWLPGHTLGHIAYVNETYLFCGDVLFGAGCGRLFEGSHEQMLGSLNQLKSLNSNTKVYCTHEYTAKNIDFALTLEPDNQDLLERKLAVANLRQNNDASIPSTIALEIKTNPFLRCNQPSIIENSKAENRDELSVFSKIRTQRNHY
ncbi:MAG: hydroxyacylglutathione hydrolase [Methylophilaceae bacterium]